jgi:uncharacterized protein
VMGRIASGKSTLARMLGRELDWQVFSSDVVRKTLARVPLHRRVVDAKKKQQLYADEMTERTYQALLENAIRHVRKRQSAIIDATYSRRFNRDQLRDRLRSAEVAFCFVEARASNKIVRRRLEERTGKAAQVSDARIEDFDTLSESYEPPTELPAPEFAATETSKAPPEATITNVLKTLAERRARLGGGHAKSRRPAGARSPCKIAVRTPSL